MGELETITVNGFMWRLRDIQDDLRAWADGNDWADQRHVAMVCTKLEEAELLAQRIVRETGVK